MPDEPSATTPSAYEAERVTAARTPSAQAGEAVQEAAARHDDADTTDIEAGGHRTAKEIMNDPDDPRSPLQP